MGGSISRAARVKVMRPEAKRPAVVDSNHASTIFLISQRLPPLATLVLNSSEYHVFTASGSGPLRNDAHQRAVEQLIEKHTGKCDVLLTSHKIVPGAAQGPQQLVVTTTPVTVALSDEHLASLPTIRPASVQHQQPIHS